MSDTGAPRFTFETPEVMAYGKQVEIICIPVHQLDLIKKSIMHGSDKLGWATLSWSLFVAGILAQITTEPLYEFGKYAIAGLIVSTFILGVIFTVYYFLARRDAYSAINEVYAEIERQRNGRKPQVTHN